MFFSNYEYESRHVHLNQCISLAGHASDDLFIPRRSQVWLRDFDCMTDEKHTFRSIADSKLPKAMSLTVRVNGVFALWWIDGQMHFLPSPIVSWKRIQQTLATPLRYKVGEVMEGWTVALPLALYYSTGTITVLTSLLDVIFAHLTVNLSICQLLPEPSKFLLWWCQDPVSTAPVVIAPQHQSGHLEHSAMSVPHVAIFQ